MRAAAGWVSLILGLGFGLPGAYGALHYARNGEVWTFLGFPTYGGGPFEKLGLQTSVPLLLAFVVVCAAEVVLAVVLWQGSSAAAALSWILLPLELFFWIGFALPFGPVLGLARVALLAFA